MNSKGQHIADYGKTQAIFMGCVCGCLFITGKKKKEGYTAACLILCVAIVGKEERNKDFNQNLTQNKQSNHIGPDEIKAHEVEQGLSSSHL